MAANCRPVGDLTQQATELSGNAFWREVDLLPSDASENKAGARGMLISFDVPKADLPCQKGKRTVRGGGTAVFAVSATEKFPLPGYPRNLPTDGLFLQVVGPRGRGPRSRAA